MCKEEQLISIIVPVYNVEPYIRECVDSILAQTYTKYELILVDDGSTDNSGLICDQLQLLDHRIKVIHKTNGGLSDARNRGIEVAVGDYLMFVDSDDWLSETCIELFLNTAINYNVEIVQGLFFRDANNVARNISNTVKTYYNKSDVLKNYFLYQGLEGHACNKLYVSRLFKSLRYPFGKIQEDAWTTYKAFYQAKGVAIVFANTYYYRVNQNSIMNGEFNPKRFDIMDVPGEIQRYLDSYGEGSEYKNELAYFTMRLGFKTYHDCLQKTGKDRYKSELQQVRKRITEQKVDRSIWERKYRCLYYMLKFCPRIYNRFISITRR